MPSAPPSPQPVSPPRRGKQIESPTYSPKVLSKTKKQNPIEFEFGSVYNLKECSVQLERLEFEDQTEDYTLMQFKYKKSMTPKKAVAGTSKSLNETPSPTRNRGRPKKDSAIWKVPSQVAPEPVIVPSRGKKKLFQIPPESIGVPYSTESILGDDFDIGSGIVEVMSSGDEINDAPSKKIGRSVKSASLLKRQSTKVSLATSTPKKTPTKTAEKAEKVKTPVSEKKRKPTPFKLKIKLSTPSVRAKPKKTPEKSPKAVKPRSKSIKSKFPDSYYLEKHEINSILSIMVERMSESEVKNAIEQCRKRKSADSDSEVSEIPPKMPRVEGEEGEVENFDDRTEDTVNQVDQEPNEFDNSSEDENDNLLQNNIGEIVDKMETPPRGELNSTVLNLHLQIKFVRFSRLFRRKFDGSSIDSQKTTHARHFR